MDNQQRLALAKQAALLAGEIHRQCYQTQLQVETKSSGVDLVTQVDRQCDEVISKLLQSHCPDDLFLTEETFEEHHDIDLSHTWVVDPLDGTTNYAHGFPFFAVSIAYVKDGIPQVGVVYDALRQECYAAIRGQGAFLNESPLQVSPVSQLNQALLATGFPYDIQENPDTNMSYFTHFLTHSHGVRRAGAAALDLSYVAGARLDGFWEMRLSPWDVMAGALLIEEAGGCISNFAGQPLDYGQRRINIVGANNPTLLEQLVEVCHSRPLVV